VAPLKAEGKTANWIPIPSGNIFQKQGRVKTYFLQIKAKRICSSQMCTTRCVEVSYSGWKYQ
jgi:hypothetical protein